MPLRLNPRRKRPYTAKEIAARFGVSESTVRRNAARLNPLKTRTETGAYQYRASSVAKFVKTRKAAAAPVPPPPHKLSAPAPRRAAPRRAPIARPAARPIRLVPKSKPTKRAVALAKTRRVAIARKPGKAKSRVTLYPQAPPPPPKTAAPRPSDRERVEPEDRVYVDNAAVIAAYEGGIEAAAIALGVPVELFRRHLNRDAISPRESVYLQGAYLDYYDQNDAPELATLDRLFLNLGDYQIMKLIELIEAEDGPALRAMLEAFEDDNENIAGTDSVFWEWFRDTFYPKQ